MDELAKPAVPSSELSKPPGYCAYCGAPLKPGFYFCVACATPYKGVESVLPRLLVEKPTEGVLIAKRAPHVAPLFWTFLAVVVGTAIVSHALFEGDRPDLALLFQAASLFVTTSIFAAIHWRSLAVQLKRFGFFRPAAVLALGALAPLLVMNYAYHHLFLQALGLDVDSPLARLREAGLGEPALIFFFCVFPAVTEEIAFRGLVQHWLQIAVRPVFALVLASALFTALHFSIISAPYLFAVGMVLGWAKWKTGSLYPCMLIHFVHNLVVVELFWR